MRRGSIAVLFACALVTSGPSRGGLARAAAEGTQPPAGSSSAAAVTGAAIPGAPTRFVTDQVGFLSAATRAELDGRLQAFAGTSGHQVLLWIGRSTGGVSIEEWAARAFASWRVGQKGLDDGVALFIMGDDRKLRIEVGYGLEERLTDARAATIIREAIVPRLQAGDRDGAARAGVSAILAAVGGEAGGVEPVQGGEEAPHSLGWGEIVGLGVLALLLLGFLVTHPNLAVLLLTTLASGRRGGGGGSGWGGGGGGGFSGGGGRSGGGGATGSW